MPSLCALLQLLWKYSKDVAYLCAAYRSARVAAGCPVEHLISSTVLITNIPGVHVPGVVNKVGCSGSSSSSNATLNNSSCTVLSYILCVIGWRYGHGDVVTSDHITCQGTNAKHRC